VMPDWIAAASAARIAALVRIGRLVMAASV
jgi:hypothetical protein